MRYLEFRIKNKIVVGSWDANRCVPFSSTLDEKGIKVQIEKALRDDGYARQGFHEGILSDEDRNAFIAAFGTMLAFREIERWVHPEWGIVGVRILE